MQFKNEIKNKIFSLVKEYYQKFMRPSPDGNIPVSGKKFDDQELCSVINAVLDGWWTEGEVTKGFEKKFNQFLAIKHTLVVNSGSSANFIALKTLTSQKLGERRIKKGDEIITVAAGFPTTINPIIECGCTPVFCDIEIQTYSINTQELNDAISPKTRAIFLAHTLGNPFDLHEIKKFCLEKDLWLIEDACDALGSLYDGKYVGTYGDLGTFSFYPAHQITMGEGGAVVTKDDGLIKIARSIRDWGRDCWCDTGKDNTCGKRFEWQLGNLPNGYDHKYIYSEIGYNLKNTDLNVAIGLAQLDKLEEFIKLRRRNFELLFIKLKKFEAVFYLPRNTTNSIPCWFGFPITLKPNVPFTRLDILKYLEKNKIATRLLFAGNIIRQPYFIDYKINYRIVKDLKNTDYIMNNTFWIGINPLITKDNIDFIEKILESFLNEYTKN